MWLAQLNIQPLVMKYGRLGDFHDTKCLNFKPELTSEIEQNMVERNEFSFVFQLDSWLCYNG